MLDPDYPSWKERCSANFDQSCISYFLALPRADLYTGSQNRGDFARNYCSDKSRMEEVPCEVLCRDSPQTCREERERYCTDATLEQVEDGTRANCACYLPQSEYRRHIERLRERLGDVVADQLLVAIGSPYCFYSPCSRNPPGLATRRGGCQNVAACVQNITIDTNDGSNVIATNVCNINTAIIEGDGGGGTTQPPPTTVTISPYLWLGLGLLILILIIAIIAIVWRNSIKKREEEENRKKIALLSLLARR